MKRQLMASALLASAMTATMVCAPTRARADASHPVIGFCAYDMTSFIALGKHGAEAVAAADGAKLLWVSAKLDVNTQVSQIEQFINQKVDAIVVTAVNSATLAPQFADAQKAGIPVIVTNLAASPAAMKIAVSYVGPDDVKAGEQEARHLMDTIGHKGNIVVIRGVLGQSGDIDRFKGINNVLAENPNVHMLAAQPADWARNKAYSVMQDWLSRYGTKIDGIISENDDQAIGAIQALKEKGLAGKIPITGVDGIKDGMRAVRDSTLRETNLQDGMLELGEAVQIAIDHVKGKQVPKLATMIMPEVTKDNVEHYYGQMFSEQDKFLQDLPSLIQKDIASGNYAFQ